MTKQSKMSSKKNIKDKEIPCSARDIIRMGILLLSDTDFWAKQPMPYFTEEDTEIILRILFFKPKNIRIKEYHRTRKEGELPLRRRMFINHLIGAARFNRAKAARMAGYSPRSAKQIAYNIMHNC